MKRFLILAVLFAGGLTLAPAAQAGVFIGIGGPPVYGGYYAPRPIVVAPPPVVVARPPVIVGPPVYYGRPYGYGGYYGHHWHHRW